MRYPFKRRYNKFNNRSQHCFSNHLHDSKLEAGYCNQLLALKRAGGIVDYECQKTFHLTVNGVHICDHRVDFLVQTNDDRQEVHEVKGFGTMIWYMKMRLFEALYPEIEYHVIKKAQVYKRGE